MEKFILAIDQGTTSSRCIIFNHQGEAVGVGQESFAQHYPKPGWVEHDPDDLWVTTITAIDRALGAAGITGHDVAGIGITNQRETTIVWSAKTGKPIYPAIVWQCRRTASLCETLKKEGREAEVKAKTGLVMDAYFSASKIKWILDEVPGARLMADAGELMFGNVDAWLIYRLTGGKSHATDYSNASRTMLFNIHTLSWDAELCALFGIPMNMLPEAQPSASDFGTVTEGIIGIESLAGVGICAVIGDQPAALFGQMALDPGDLKNTYGTGCFCLMNTGENIVSSENGLLTSAAWTLNGKTTYALEGSVFNGGSTIQWLRDEMQMISRASECDTLAESVEDNAGVYLVPAFSGLGAPYWDMYARGTIVGLTRGTGKAHIARACLEAIAYQVYDLIELMKKDSGFAVTSLRVDGGASVSAFLMQFQADILDVPVDRPRERETTAQGAAYMAGISCGYWQGTDELRHLRTCDKLFVPNMKAIEKNRLIDLWNRAVARSGKWADQ